MQPGEGQHVGERRPVAEAGEVGVDRHAGAAHRVAALAPDADDRLVARVLGDLARDEADRVRVERAGEAAVRRDQHEQTLALGRLLQERVVLAAEDRRDVREDLVDLLAVRAGREGRVLGAPELRRRHELHGARDLLDVLGRVDPPPDIPLASHGTSPPSPYAPAAGSSEAALPEARVALGGVALARRRPWWPCPSAACRRLRRQIVNEERLAERVKRFGERLGQLVGQLVLRCELLEDLRALGLEEPVEAGSRTP